MRTFKAVTVPSNTWWPVTAAVTSALQAGEPGDVSAPDRSKRDTQKLVSTKTIAVVHVSAAGHLFGRTILPLAA
jgi:hypothetical protein